MPSQEGTNTIEVGHTGANIWASWPAPEHSRRWLKPSSTAARSTRSIMSGSNSTGANRARRREVIPVPDSAANSSRKAARRFSASVSRSSSVLRMSTVSTASEATTFTRLGCSSTRPTVHTCGGPNSVASSCTNTAMRVATHPASWRMSMGVVPAWFDWPATVISVQLMPCTPVTAPITMPSVSSIGPCSMCNSTKACGAGDGHGAAPR